MFQILFGCTNVLDFVRVSECLRFCSGVRMFKILFGCPNVLDFVRCPNVFDFYVHNLQLP